MTSTVSFMSVLMISVPLAMQGQHKGAKAIFLDAVTGAPLVSRGEENRDPIKPKVRHSPQSVLTTPHERVRTRTGLRYWLQTKSPDGRLERVGAARVFHSGERVRLHIETSVDGRLVVLQKQDSGDPEILFPDQRIRDGDDRVVAGKPTVIPSEKAWFKFDDRPGEITLLLMLVPDNGAVREVPSRTIPQPEQRTAQQYAAEITRAQRTRGLVVEVDTVSAEPATYVVRPQDGTGAAQNNVIGVDIRLNHRP